MKEPRPLQHLARIADRFPKFWKTYEHMRSDRGKGLPEWPTWCYCPLAGSYAIASKGGDNRLSLDQVDMVSALGALSAWRVTKGIYRFDPTLGKALVDTPIKGDMPIEVLFRMPEWCVYIETTGLIEGVEGFFAHMEKDANTGGIELRLLVDSGPIESPLLQPVPIHLFPGGNLEESIRAFLRVAEDRVGVSDLFPMDQVASYYTKMTEPMVSLLLYLCSEEPDYGERTPPIHPVKAKLKHAADKPMAWDVGVRIGAILRKAEAEPATTTEPAIESGTLETKEHGTHASPRPHVRRAHWHSFWVGPKGNQRPRLKWLSPMLVGGAENVATIKQVK